jgi:hypothetical protein
MKTFKCKEPGCGHEEQGNSPSVMIPHARDVHGKTNRRARAGERPTRRRTSDAPAGPDAEATLLGQCITAFTTAGTDRYADQRVLDYLNSRFGPSAYADD